MWNNVPALQWEAPNWLCNNKVFFSESEQLKELKIILMLTSFYLNVSCEWNYGLKLVFKKFLYPALIFCTPNFAYQEVQKTPVKTFGGHTDVTELP